MYWDFEGDYDSTTLAPCRANPPVPVADRSRSAWPYTLPEDWCGKWLPIPEYEDTLEDAS